jgi:pilus assembly protein CpaB
MLQLSRPVLITIAFTLALITALIVRSWVDAAREHATPAPTVATETAKGQPKMVLVAAQTLPAGHFLKAEDMTWQAWPDANLMPEYILQGGEKHDEFAGSVVRNGIAAGEPITAGRLVKRGDRGFLAAVLKPGYRAMTVPLSSNAGLSGLVVPGDHVDVILTTQVSGGSDKEVGHRVSETVLDDIRVLAIDQKLDDQSKEAIMAHTATLEVTPKQAEILTLVSEMGKLAMSLRSVGSASNDSEEPGLTRTWDSEATDLYQKPATQQEAKASAVKVGVTRGTSETVVDFNKAGK